MSEKKIKVLIWDLDNTVWDGVLLEDKSVTLRAGVADVIKELDRRGILQSIASKNAHDDAMEKLKEFGLDQYFIYPQINWSSKAESVGIITQSINVGIDTIAFIDDQPFEREEVAFTHKEVLCLEETELDKLLDRDEFMPRFVTSDSKNRRAMYQSDITRNKLEEDFTGPTEEFLATLNLEMTITPATDDDLQRAEELTQRTHQLNTTGYTYTYDELRKFIESDEHDLLIASLNDKYGTYGKIGVCLIERNQTYWNVKLLLMSCRVMSRGVGTIMINHIISEASKAGVTLRAEFIQTDRNRMMFITYRLGNFEILKQEDNRYVLENDCTNVAKLPPYISLNVIKGKSKQECEVESEMA
ncbi:HAD-IIIC family phosphatase [Idiomarina xiamenensis]|uniref:FkbH-like protein n=1 Tax=Idiomarina xiamenensis 10-D-4 TaxID=740709 RepID=K2KDS4_9GAMM|nr:HAD-IIIC family phosphatase [Idiomarina xiamenensis]EKE80859.1 FkbH-like protein [Idiomarina xiamenensis 10-D-4]